MERPFKLPDLGEGIHEAEILNIRVLAGDAVREGDVLFEVETDKATVEMPSPLTGVVSSIRVKVGNIVHVGDVLLVFSMDEGDARISAPEDAIGRPPVFATPAAEDAKVIPASPATRRLARELGVDLRQVRPTGPGGRVMAEDVRAHAQKGPDPPRGPEFGFSQSTAPSRSPEPGVEATVFGPVERMPIRSIRRATAKHMARAWAEIPHVTSQDEVDITDLEALRQKHKGRVAEMGGRLTLTVFAIKAMASAIRHHPQFNATLEAASDTLIVKKYIHVGVAVDTADGLVVPVIRDVDRKSILDLSIELNALTDRARARKLSIEDLQGGSITLTNIGHLGGTHFTPIINHPQVAILGMGAARYKPMVVPAMAQDRPGSLEIVPRLMLPLVIAMDHRIIDGGDAMRFLNHVRELMGDPERMLLSLT